MADQERLYEALRAFAATIAGDYDVSDVLHDVCDHLVSVIGCTGAGVSLVDDKGGFRFATATPAAVEAAERAQEETQRGPCREALVSGSAVMVADLGSDQRWPDFCAAASGSGMAAVLAVPMLLCDSCIGALDLYDRAPRDWTPSDVAAATVLAQMATGFVIRANAHAEIARVNDQLQTALDSRVVIEQAKGKLAGEHAIDVDEAFQHLRSFARSHNETVRSVAERVVTGDLDPVASESLEE